MQLRYKGCIGGFSCTTRPIWGAMPTAVKARGWHHDLVLRDAVKEANVLLILSGSYAQGTGVHPLSAQASTGARQPP